IALHWRAAGELSRAAQRTVEAAERAANCLAFDRAARLYRSALDMILRPRHEERELQIALGEALANAGRGPESAEAYALAAEGAPGELASDLLARAAWQLIITGRIQDGLDRLARVLEPMGMTIPKTPIRALPSFVFARARLSLRGLESNEVPAEQASKRDLAR